MARGRTPGSLKLVRSRVPITKKNKMPPTTGMAGVIFTARYGQLPTGGGSRKGGKREVGAERRSRVKGTGNDRGWGWGKGDLRSKPLAQVQTIRR